MPEGSANDSLDSEYKKKIIGVLETLWGESLSKTLESYYQDKSGSETYASAYKLLRVYFGEDSARKLLEGPDNSKTISLQEEPKAEEDIGHFNRYVLQIIILGAFLASSYYLGIDGYMPQLAKIIVPMIPIYFGVRAVRYFGTYSLQGKSILLLMGAIFLWLVGDIISVIDQSVVSEADLFYIIGYGALLLTFIYSIRIIDPKYSFLKDAVKDFLIVLTIVLSGVLYIIFFKFSWNDTLGFMQNLVTTGYVLWDVILIVILFIIIGLVFMSRYNLVWILILSGVTLGFMGDVYYSLSYTSYAIGDMVDLFWLGKYLLFGWAIINLKTITERSITQHVNTQIL